MDSQEGGVMGFRNLLDTKEAATRLGISEQRVRQFCEEGRLGTKFAGRWVIPETALRTFKPNPTGRPRLRKKKEARAGSSDRKR